MRGVAGQHRIKTHQRTQRLSAKMRDCDGQRLKPGKVLMLMMFSHFAHLASQVGGELAERDRSLPMFTAEVRRLVSEAASEPLSSAEKTA